MTTDLPSPTREYRNHHLDSTRWRSFQPRDDDVIVTTVPNVGRLSAIGALIAGSGDAPTCALSLAIFNGTLVIRGGP